MVTRGTDETFDEPALGQQPSHGRLALRWLGLGGRLSFDLVGTAYERQDRVATERFEQPTAGFTVVDAGARVEFGERIGLQLWLENLTDKAYTDHLSAPIPFTGERVPEAGRSARLGFDIAF